MSNSSVRDVKHPWEPQATHHNGGTKLCKYSEIVLVKCVQRRGTGNLIKTAASLTENWYYVGHIVNPAR